MESRYWTLAQVIEDEGEKYPTYRPIGKFDFYADAVVEARRFIGKSERVCVVTGERYGIVDTYNRDGKRAEN